MHPDIKTFSDLLDIDTSRSLLVEVALRVNGNIEYVLTINDQEVIGDSWQGSFDLVESLHFSCNITEFDPGHSGIDICDISVNGVSILPLYCGKATPPVNYLNFLGTWDFRIDRPFYVWLHDITGQGWIA